MRAERLWIHHTEEIQVELIGTSLPWQALFIRIFQASQGKPQARSVQGAPDTPFPVARVWRSSLASRLPSLASKSEKITPVMQANWNRVLVCVVSWRRVKLRNEFTRVLSNFRLIWWRNFFNLDTILALISMKRKILSFRGNFCANLLANLSPMIIIVEIVAKILKNLPEFMFLRVNISPRWPAATGPGFPRMIRTLRRKGIINSPWRKEIIYKMSVLFKVYVPTLYE